MRLGDPSVKEIKQLSEIQNARARLSMEVTGEDKELG